MQSAEHCEGLAVPGLQDCEHICLPPVALAVQHLSSAVADRLMNCGACGVGVQVMMHTGI